jgi:hypothetical protein
VTEDFYVQRYRRLRNGLGWLILAVWLLYRWASLSAQQAAAKVAMTDCDGVLDWAKCGISDASGSLGFGAGMLFAIILSPFAFLISSYIARFWVDKEMADASNRERDEQERQRMQFEQSRKEREASVLDEASRAKHATNRINLIACLGTVNEYLDILDGTPEKDEEPLVRQSIGNSLRELIAKNTLPEIIALVQSDEAVHLVMGKTLQRLNASALGSEAAMVLEYAYSMRDTTLAGKS